MSTFLLYYGTQHSRCGLSSAEERRRIIPWPAGGTHSNAAEEAVGLHCCKSALLAHVRLGVHKNLNLSEKLLSEASPQPALMHGGFHPLGAGLLNSFCWASWDSCLPFSPACRVTQPEQSYKHVVYQLVLPSLVSANCQRVCCVPLSRSLMEM